jgi:hypothetical protein
MHVFYYLTSYNSNVKSFAQPQGSLEGSNGALVISKYYCRKIAEKFYVLTRNIQNRFIAISPSGTYVYST